MTNLNSIVVAERSYATSKEWRLCGRRRAQRSYSTFKVRRGNHEETPLSQGKFIPRYLILFVAVPYVGIVLNGVKTLETWWWPMLCGHCHCALAIHIAHWDSEDSVWWEMLEQRLGMSPAQTQALLQDGDKFGCGVIIGK
ncbi:unnamed protein product [Rangifer tarandus platyrhynchus]|uniref:Uncharacterized protein n=1 Tax=Rangifer tarandus platyrhynchus TaxID=3082113 RepID=A0ABN9A773_RANTA|nr:unnamed protein product [Rangifer tarandus platyrhynchus]